MRYVRAAGRGVAAARGGRPDGIVHDAHGEPAPGVVGRERRGLDPAGGEEDDGRPVEIRPAAVVRDPSSFEEEEAVSNSLGRRGGSDRPADVRARRVPADYHEGSARDFRRRHQREPADATRRERRERCSTHRR